jgi:hypothetical protein
MKRLAPAEEKRLKNNTTRVSPAPYRAIHQIHDSLVKRYWPVIALFTPVNAAGNAPLGRSSQL